MKNFEVVHLHPAINISDIGRVWKQEPTPTNQSLWSNMTSANWTNSNNETVSLAPYEAAIVYGLNEITLTNLKHYQEYNIEVSGV